MNYRFLTPALAEIREAAEFYENRVSGLGADFLDEVIRRWCASMAFRKHGDRLAEDIAAASSEGSRFR